MHGLSNRVLGIVSTMQLGALLDAKVLVDWRMDDSKFIGASMRELFNMSELPAFAGPFRRQRLNRPRSDWDGACAGYYRQRRSGWHTAGGGGGFAGPDPAAAFLDYMATRAPPCNDTGARRGGPLASAARAGRLTSSKRVAVAGARGAAGRRRPPGGPLWSRGGNVVSLAEQLSLGSADAVLGTWGSTFSSVAAAWFDRPVDYVPARATRPASRRGRRGVPRRGKAHYPTAESSWRFGAKCPELNAAVERRRRGEPARLDVAALALAPLGSQGAGADAPRRRPRRKRRPWLG
ncbi:hypothetical protein SO694_00048148 [Aureococcus anophagefferens]|uniref:Uncharacterized protein n=1 Tax=Aureococcus anophagefferens TaxID=44056 RepID=A0ABR1G7X5_AURAN